MLNVATPPALRVAVPSVVPPLVKVREPVGIVVPDCAVTVAVKVMLLPAVICEAEAASLVAVAAWVCVTVTVTPEETELAKEVEP